LGFHKQMDNRIKLLEEILSFRMQGVEFDNGDMYVDGHKAASDVRDEFVSVTEKLMDELAQCYNVLSNLFLSLILHLGNLFLIVQLHFSKLFLILKSGVNHTSRGSISTSTLPSIKLR